MAVVHMKSFEESDVFKKSSALFANRNAFTSTVEQVRVGQAIYSTGSLFNHSCKPNVHAYFLSRTLHLRCTEHVPAKYPLELCYGPQIGEQDLQERQEMLEDQYQFKCRCIACSELNFSDLVINSFRCPNAKCIGAIPGMAYEKLEDDSLLVFAASYHFRLSFPEFEECKTNISEVAYFLLQNEKMPKIGPGNCLNCYASLHLTSAISLSDKSLADIDRMKNMIVSFESHDYPISDILTSLCDLRSIRHACSKFIAKVFLLSKNYSSIVIKQYLVDIDLNGIVDDTLQAEDNVAETFAMIGLFEDAKKHCHASIEILEKLFHAKHIIVAHERMKLASIHFSLGNRADALCDIIRAEEIFFLYYGSHVSKIFPYIENFKREVEKI